MSGLLLRGIAVVRDARCRTRAVARAAASRVLRPA